MNSNTLIPAGITGQWWASGGGATLGLYDYGARWYDPSLAKFIQADTIVPEPGNPQSLTLRHPQG